MFTNDIKYLISAIGNLDDNNERIEYYELNQKHLIDYNMIFVDTIFGLDKTEYLNEIANLNYDVNSLYYSNKLLCINETVLRDKNRGRSTYLKNQVCVSFDVQIVSQLKRYTDNHFQDPDLTKIIKLCKSGRCTFDIMPFIIENSFKREDGINFTAQDLEDIRAFETLFPNYDNTSSNIDEYMESFLAFQQRHESRQLMEYFYTIYKAELLYLLAIIYIHFKFTTLSPQNKFEKFLEFCNNEIFAFNISASNLAKLFYENTSLRFFKKIQKNNKTIIKDIKNMAWDIFHLKNLEMSAGISECGPDVILIPILISRDKGLNEIRSAFQVKCLFHNMRTRRTTCAYYSNAMNYGHSLKYFNEKSVKHRANIEVNLDVMIEKLKESVSRIIL
ncbi:MAG: hypothetical protein FWH03_02175 [Firmicutes bacterium]|nr:hypothetical protein [Bacillota bacterium]